MAETPRQQCRDVIGQPGHLALRMLLLFSLSLLLFSLLSASCRVSLDAVYARAHLQLDDGNLSGALNEAEKGLEESTHVSAKWTLRFRILKAEILLSRNSPLQALQLLDSQLPSESSSPDLDAARELIQGRALCSLGEFRGAQALLDDAKQLAGIALPELLGDVALAQGMLFQLTKDFGKAEESLQDSLQLAREYHNQILEARVLSNVGSLRGRQGRYDEAIDALAKSQKLSQTVGARGIETMTDLSLGLSYVELGDLHSASNLFRETQRLSSDLGWREVEIRSIVNIGRIYLSEENYPDAKDYFDKALGLISDENESRTLAAVCYDGLALIALETGNLSEADAYNRRAVALTPRNDDSDLAANFEPLLTAARICAARQQFTEAKRYLLAVLRDPSKRLSLYWRAEAEMASIYAADGKAGLAERTFRDVIKALAGFRSGLIRPDSRLAFSTNAAEIYGGYLHFLVAQNREKVALGISDLGRAVTLAEGLDGMNEHPRIGTLIERAQSLLKQNQQTVLVYWLAHRESFLWVVTPFAVHFFVLPSRHELATRVDAYERALLEKAPPGLNGVGEADRLGRELFDLLVEPAQPFIRRGSSVVIIPDGRLNNLNFETLLAGTRRYWIEDVEIQSAKSIQLFIKSDSKRPEPSKKLLLIGNPVQVNSDYPALRFASTEMERVAGHFPRPLETVIAGKDAVPGAYAKSSPVEFDIIHFVTHGIASEISPLDSAIVLSLGPDNSYKLYAREIVSIPIRADLVVISACYGAGVTPYSGEGLIGLAWAFMRAGARHVIAGLWDVDDYAETQLMDYFYGDLSSGISFAAALRSAKLAMLHSNTVYKNPAYWGPLQLYTGY